MLKNWVVMIVFSLFTSVCIVVISIFPVDVKATNGFYDPFDSYDSSHWFKSHGWSNGDMFNCTWYEEQITFSNGEMRLSIDQEVEGKSPGYKGAEYRTNDFSGHGLYEVSMKPAKRTGVVSSFFTYTGPSENDPWDEIDIEFLGKDTTKVQFNYFTDGVGGNEVYYDLGFDASLSYHVYAFDWRPDSITWFVNGEVVHKVTENIPNHPGKIMMNVWPGIGVDSWLGNFDGETPVHAYYDWVRFTPMDELGEAIHAEEKGGKKLPKTSTWAYLYLMIGVLILFIGAYVYVRVRKIGRR